MALMFLRSSSRVKTSVVLTRADNLCIHNYIRSLLNILLIPILMVRRQYDNPSDGARTRDLLLMCLTP